MQPSQQQPGSGSIGPQPYVAPLPTQQQGTGSILGGPSPIGPYPTQQGPILGGPTPLGPQPYPMQQQGTGSILGGPIGTQPHQQQGMMGSVLGGPSAPYAAAQTTTMQPSQIGSTFYPSTTTTTTTTVQDPFDLLIADHVVLRSLLGQLSNATATDAQTPALLRHLIGLECAHTSAEERFIHPLYVQFLGPVEGARFAAESAAADAEGKRLQMSLESVDVTKDFTAFQALLKSYAATLTAHLDEEERIYFPILRAKFPQADLPGLYARVVSAKASGPTHPHPHMGSSSGPLSKITHPLMGLFDKAKDSLAGYNKK
jgi:hypothetical protein